MNIEVSEEVGLHLKQLAEERDLTMDELVGAMLERYDVKRRKGVTLAELAANTAKANLATPHPVDTSERSCEILNTRYAEHLKQRGMSTTELIEKLEKEYPPGSLARLAQVALKAGMASNEPVDTSGRSREILNTEYADYLKKRRTSCP